jgi:DNA-nicking Smr family endonuclease
VLIYASSRLGCDCMHDDEEPVRIPITEVFDLHAVEPREVAAVVEAYLEEAARLGLKYCAHHPRSRHRCPAGFVRAVLARTPFVVSYRDAPPEAGGWGATIVSLQRN